VTRLVRVDFNVPIKDGKVGRSAPHHSGCQPSLHLGQRPRKFVIASHLGRPDGKVVEKSAWAVQRYLQDSLNIPVAMATDCVGSGVESLVRAETTSRPTGESPFHPEEEKTRKVFPALATLADVYVDDAFGAAHRAHASIAGMAKHFNPSPAFATERARLPQPAVGNPAKPFVTILGGAKSPTDRLIKTWLQK